MDVKDIVQFHGHITGEMNLIVSQKIMADNQKITSQMKRMLDILEELPVKFSKPDDVPQMRDLLRQRVDENLSDLTTKRGQVNGSKKEEGKISCLHLEIINQRTQIPLPRKVQAKSRIQRSRLILISFLRGCL